MSRRNSPIIVVGMHRSGTSLVSRLLHEAGLWMGADQNSHYESKFFLARNRMIFNIAHAAWDNPEPMWHLLACDEIRSGLVELLKADVVPRRYWGLSRWLRKRDGPWGWKDPRSSFTLPIWLDIFPNAKVIHIYRNGVDVAASLRARERERIRRLDNRLFSVRCMSLDGAFNLWVEYENTILNVTETLPVEQRMRMRYEYLLMYPADALSTMLRFVGVTIGETLKDNLSSGIRSDRAFAFRDDTELMPFYKQKAGHLLMRRYDFNRLL